MELPDPEIARLARKIAPRGSSLAKAARAVIPSEGSDDSEEEEEDEEEDEDEDDENTGDAEDDPDAPVDPDRDEDVEGSIIGSEPESDSDAPAEDASMDGNGDAVIAVDTPVDVEPDVDLKEMEDNETTETTRQMTDEEQNRLIEEWDEHRNQRYFGYNAAEYHNRCAIPLIANKYIKQDKLKKANKRIRAANKRAFKEYEEAMSRGEYVDPPQIEPLFQIIDDEDEDEDKPTTTASSSSAAMTDVSSRKSVKSRKSNVSMTSRRTASSSVAASSSSAASSMPIDDEQAKIDEALARMQSKGRK